MTATTVFQALTESAQALDGIHDGEGTNFRRTRQLAAKSATTANRDSPNPPESEMRSKMLYGSRRHESYQP